MPNSQFLYEVTPLHIDDAMYIAERHKESFTFPIHTHNAYELNFLERAGGALRVVGDSTEVIGDYDLVLIASPSLEHAWRQHECQSKDIFEITIQFNPINDTIDGLLRTNPFKPIRRMLADARQGIVFNMAAIMYIYKDLINLCKTPNSCDMALKFISILNKLATYGSYRQLAAKSYTSNEEQHDNKRMTKVIEYIEEHYMDEVKLKDCADVACISTGAFSRFFKQHTGKTLSDYVIDVRLGHACRDLIESSETISQISFNCGYNNISNFNRIFRSKKGCSPTEFRANYMKKKIII